MRQQLPCGRWFLFDEQDAALVAAYKWHMVGGYVQTEVGNRARGNRRNFRLHRLIMQPKAHELVDHRNRDRLDNRRPNLRIADRSQNGMNRGAQRNNTSGFKGVSLHRTGKWRAYITADGKTRHLGLFATPAEAHRAYSIAAQALHKEFACPA